MLLYPKNGVPGPDSRSKPTTICPRSLKRSIMSMTYLPILTYHRVINEEPTKAVDPQRIAVSAAQLRSHLQWLKQLGYCSLSMNRYAAMLNAGEPVPSGVVGITFDDAYEEMITLALPILKEQGFIATVFS